MFSSRNGLEYIPILTTEMLVDEGLNQQCKFEISALWQTGRMLFQRQIVSKKDQLHSVMWNAIFAGKSSKQYFSFNVVRVTCPTTRRWQTVAERSQQDVHLPQDSKRESEDWHSWRWMDFIKSGIGGPAYHCRVDNCWRLKHFLWKTPAMHEDYLQCPQQRPKKSWAHNNALGGGEGPSTGIFSEVLRQCSTPCHIDSNEFKSFNGLISTAIMCSLLKASITSALPKLPFSARLSLCIMLLGSLSSFSLINKNYT